MQPARTARDHLAYPVSSKRLLDSASSASAARMSLEPSNRGRGYALMSSVEDRDARLTRVTSQVDSPPERGILDKI